MTKLDNFSNVRILVIGDLMLDRYWWGDVTRISPEAPVPIVKLDRTSVSAGGAANVAANAAGLGASVELVGIAGDDVENILLAEILAAVPNVEPHLITLTTRETTVKTRIVAHNQQVVRLDQESTHSISDAEAEVVANRTLDRISDVDAVIISDYAKGMLTGRFSMPAPFFQIDALAPDFGAQPGDGEGADVVIEAAGTPEAWSRALALARPGGTVVFFSGLPRGDELAVDAYRLHYEELTLRGAFHHTPRTVKAALAFLASGAYPWERLVTHRVGLEGVASLFADPPRDYLKAAVTP